jgi:predicted methyltransferase
MHARNVYLIAPLLLCSCAGSSAPPAEYPAADVAPAESVSPNPTASVGTIPPAYYQAIIEAPDRSADDRKLDDGRKPAELLSFFGIAPGQKVADLMAGGGYTTELLARAVGTSGVVYGQNSPFILERFAEKPWSARLQTPAMAHVVRVDRALDEPLPADVHDLDAVTLVLFYHDAVWMKVDRDKMNRAIFAALKPGGVYGIVDHQSRAGVGLEDVQTLHRIDEKIVQEEVERAGFKLAASGEFLKTPSDTYDWSTSPAVAGERRGTSDRFVLRFVKP